MADTCFDLDDDPFPKDDEYISSLTLLYGKPGVPEDDEVKKLMSTKVDKDDKGDNGRPVRVIRDHALEYPQLALSVFIAGDKYEEAMFAPMFARSLCQRAKSPLEADLVVFTGGPDVDPQLYGEKCHHSTHYNVKRDSDDLSLYALCFEHGIPMLGICRGAQFLNVMNGGKLFQDVDNHYGDHSMYDLDTKLAVDKVSSVHHQMVYPNPDGGMHIIAVASGKSQKRVGPNPMFTEINKAIDIEAFFYRDTCCIGVQGHPEYSGYNYFQKWVLDLINRYVAENTDVVWDTGPGKTNRRLDPSIIAERDAKLITGKKEGVN